MLQRSILCMRGTQYATKRSILCRGAFCGPTQHPHETCDLDRGQMTVKGDTKHECYWGI